MLEVVDEGEGFEEFEIFGGGRVGVFCGFGLFFLLWRWSDWGVGFGLGGDACDVKDGVGGTACDFGFFTRVHEVDEFVEGVGDELECEEF